MRSPSELLAKSNRPGRKPVTLIAHSLDTESAAARLFGPTSCLRRAFARFYGLGDAPALERFVLHLRVAALFHDLGKANEDFLAAVSLPRSDRQRVRHEHISALVLCLPGVRSWLAAGGLDVDVIIAAVLGHHLKASEDGLWQWCAPVPSSVALYLQHPEVAEILGRVAELASLAAPPPLPTEPWRSAGAWHEALDDGFSRSAALKRAVRRDPVRRALFLAIKAGVIAADSVASAVVREGLSLEGWIDETIGRLPIARQEIDDKILGPRARQLEALTGRPFEPRTFQTAIAGLGERLLLLAGCGSGKTIAAWSWAAAQLAGDTFAHVVFLYPTRGTATEGFRDYVGWAPEAEAMLLHGSSRFELADMVDNPPEALAGKALGPTEAEARLFALGLWGRRFFSATVDQFLGYLAHDYGATCLAPVMADAVLIVDEVHSFDPQMFEQLVAFAKTFHGPLLCMTATLPPARRRALEEAGLRSYPRTDAGADEATAAHELAIAESTPRYALGRLPDADAAFAAANRAVSEGLRVLWVVNTVARCQASARRLLASGHTPLVYHSRFRLMDRKDRHREVVDAFALGSRRGGVVAVTTQVCEMSLDLDADVLITELAPIPSLVQRFGRANRHLRRARAAVWVYPPPSNLPYDRDDLAAAERMVESCAGPDVEQRGLAEALARFAPSASVASGAAALLTSGYFAWPSGFREDDDHGQSAVLDRDLPAVVAALGAREPIDGWVLPAPRRHLRTDAARPARLPTFLGVADGALYHEAFGLEQESG